MLKREWQSLLKNKFLIVVLIGIITIPTIYTTIFLGSMWDPYGEVEHLPVAVVNKDIPTDYDGKTMDVGKELVDNLKENNSLDFNFVNEEQAEAGLQNGTYYMVITIPEDFSKNATTLMDENPETMELEYKTNPGTNYIASKMSETAVEKVRTSVAEKITKQYAETVFDQLSEIGDGFAAATDATDELGDGLDKLHDGSGKVATNLGKLKDSSLTFTEGANQLSVALTTYTSGVSSANDGAGQLKDGIDTLAEGAGTLASGASQLDTGAKKLDKAVGTYTGGVDQLYKDGTSKLASNNEALNDGVATLSTGLTTLKNGTEPVLAGLNQMSKKLSDSLTKENKAKFEQLKSGLPQINAGIQKMNTVFKGVDAEALTELSTTISETMPKLDKTGENITTHLTGVQTDIQKAVATISQNEGFKSLSATDQKKILAAIGAIGADDGNLKSLVADMTSMNSDLTSIKSKLGNTDLSLLSNLDTMKSQVAYLAQQSNVALPGAVTAITSLQTGLESVQDGLDRTGKTAKEMGLIQAMTAIDDGAKQLETGVNGKGGLKESIKTYTAGVDTVNTNLKTLSSNSKNLSDATGLISTSLTSLNEKVPTLTGGISKLQTGATQLAEGTNKLTANNGKLLDATGKLAEGSDKIYDATGKLEDASNTITDGLKTAKDGTKELNSELSDASDEINETKTDDQTYQMFATPVETNGSQLTSVDNNGNAMAAYMMCVGLWVGCMAFAIMYPLTTSSGKAKNGFSWWLSKASIAGLLSIVQAIVMVLMLKGILGFNPVSLSKTILIAVLASLAFMSLFYFFNLIMGKVGSFILLVFMVLQLGGSAGTYPIELSSGFYQAINPFMPFTYAVNAFRSTVASGQSLTPAITVFVGIIVVFTALTIGVLQWKINKGQAEESVADAEAVLD